MNEKEEVILKLLRVVYYISKEELPLAKYASLLQLMEMNECPLQLLKDKYQSVRTAEGLLIALNEAVNSVVSRKIHDREFLSVLCDETTDISVTGN